MTRLLTALLWACAGPPPASSGVGDAERAAGPATAHWDMVAALRDDLSAPRAASDGGGRAWLVPEESTVPARAGQPGTWTLIFEAGPQGIAEGGMLGLQVSPFWGWSTPQVEAPEALGYTVVEPLMDDPRGLALESGTWGDQLLGVRIGGRALARGERLRIRYGAGPAGALADQFAERGSRFWFLVDGDGDGVRGVVPDPPEVDVLPGPAAGLIVTLPTTLAPGEQGWLTVAAVDAAGNGWADLTGEVALAVDPPGLGLPSRVSLGVEDRGRLALPFTAGAEGLYRIRALGPGGLMAEGNPLLVSARVPRVRWGDLHGHSALSDGTGTPDDYLAYGREVAGLDFCALTDHDHWGMRFLDASPDLWALTREAVARQDQPGRMRAILGYEWTSWIWGHRHVLFFGEDGEVFSSVDPRFERPDQLWAALAGRQALSIPHHPGGGPVAIDWSGTPPSEVEPLVEIASIHGNSEAMEGPGAIYSPAPGHFARDALARGLPLGFLGGGDTHDGHPGLGHLASRQGGLVAVLDAEHSPAGILAALRSRRVYATNGARILLLTSLDGRSMGAEVPAAPAGKLVIFAVGTAPIAAAVVVRSGAEVQRIPGQGKALLEASLDLADLAPGEHLYVRVEQEDGGLAWSSPLRVGPPTGSAP